MARKPDDGSKPRPAPQPARAEERPIDRLEEPLADPAQDMILESSSTGFPVVGIGASAGGLGAFEAFFSGMPAAPSPPAWWTTCCPRPTWRPS